MSQEIEQKSWVVKKWSKRNEGKGKRRESKGQVFSLRVKRWNPLNPSKLSNTERTSRIKEQNHKHDYSEKPLQSGHTRILRTSPEHLIPTSTELIHHQLTTSSQITTAYACSLHSTALSLKQHLHSKNTNYSRNLTRIPLLQKALRKCHV